MLSQDQDSSNNVSTEIQNLPQDGPKYRDQPRSWTTKYLDSEPSDKVHSVDMLVTSDRILFLQQFLGIPIRRNELPVQEGRLITRNPVEKITTELRCWTN
jgi:hypothetical protein